MSALWRCGGRAVEVMLPATRTVEVRGTQVKVRLPATGAADVPGTSGGGLAVGDRAEVEGGQGRRDVEDGRSAMEADGGDDLHPSPTRRGFGGPAAVTTDRGPAVALGAGWGSIWNG